MRALKTIIATIVVPGAACVLAPYLILKASLVSLAPQFNLLQLIAILVALFGLSMMIWVSTAFVRHGRGTPIPFDPPTQLVRQGLYKYVRNPMYLGAFLVLTAESVYFRSLWILLYTVCLWIVLHTFIVVIEEPQLKRRFGGAYEEYLELVPRWIPRFPPAPHL